jgi:hypothetical protein
MWWIRLDCPRREYPTGTDDRFEAERILEGVRIDMRIRFKKTLQLVWRKPGSALQ